MAARDLRWQLPTASAPWPRSRWLGVRRHSRPRAAAPAHRPGGGRGVPPPRQFSIRSPPTGSPKVVSVTGGKAAGMALRLVTLVLGYLLIAPDPAGDAGRAHPAPAVGGALTGVIVGSQPSRAWATCLPGWCWLMAGSSGWATACASGRSLGGEITGHLERRTRVVVLETEEDRCMYPTARSWRRRSGATSSRARVPPRERDHERSTRRGRTREPGLPPRAPAQTSGALKVP